MDPSKQGGYPHPSYPQSQPYGQAPPMMGTAPYPDQNGIYPQPPPSYEQAQYPQPPYGFVPPGSSTGMPPVQPIKEEIFIQQQPATVVLATPMQVGPEPQMITCPSCRATQLSRVEYEPSTKTHLFAALLCLLCWPCVCLPYCMDTCKNGNHYCSNCGTFLGTYGE